MMEIPHREPLIQESHLGPTLCKGKVFTTALSDSSDSLNATGQQGKRPQLAKKLLYLESVVQSLLCWKSLMLNAKLLSLNCNCFYLESVWHLQLQNTEHLPCQPFISHVNKNVNIYLLGTRGCWNHVKQRAKCSGDCTDVCHTFLCLLSSQWRSSLHHSLMLLCLLRGKESDCQILSQLDEMRDAF